MNAQIMPFRRPPKRSADGVLYVPPARVRGIVFVAYSRLKKHARKKWLLMTQFCDGTVEHEETGAADWHTAMFVARVRAAKYGFEAVDLSDYYGGRTADD